MQKNKTEIKLLIQEELAQKKADESNKRKEAAKKKGSELIKILDKIKKIKEKNNRKFNELGEEMERLNEEERKIDKEFKEKTGITTFKIHETSTKEGMRSAVYRETDLIYARILLEKDLGDLMKTIKKLVKETNV